MFYRHAYLNNLLLLHSAFMLSVVNMPLKGEAGGHALNSHGNYIVDRGKSWKNHEIVFFNFCGNPVVMCRFLFHSLQCVTHMISSIKIPSKGKLISLKIEF